MWTGRCCPFSILSTKDPKRAFVLSWFVITVSRWGFCFAFPWGVLQPTTLVRSQLHLMHLVHPTWFDTGLHRWRNTTGEHATTISALLKRFLGSKVSRLLSSTMALPRVPFSVFPGPLTPSRMVMLLRHWALAFWPPWQTGRTLFRVVTFSAREMTVKWPKRMAILLTKGAFSRVWIPPMSTCAWWFAIGGTTTDAPSNGILPVDRAGWPYLPWHWCNPKRSSNISTDGTFLVRFQSISSGQFIPWLHGRALLPLPCYGAKWTTD